MKHLYKLADGLDISWPGIKIKSYSEVADFARASAGRFWVDGQHGKVLSEVSDRIYLVLSGSGWFEIEDEHFKVVETDVVIVPKQTTYNYGGKMELFLVHAPAFDPGKERKFMTRMLQ